VKILLVQTGFIGDVILSTAVIDNLHAIYPEAELHLLTTPVAGPLLESHELLTKVYTYDKRRKDSGLPGLMRMVRKIRSENYGIAFSLHKSYRTAALLFLARIPVRYGFSEASAPFLYTQTVSRKDQVHEVLRNLAILRNVGRQPDMLMQRLRIDVPKSVMQESKKYYVEDSSQRLIVVAPGSIWATKRWTVAGFAGVCRSLVRDGSQVILIGGPEDANLANEIEDQAGVPLRNLVGKTSLLESAALVSAADLLLSNDSAPLHIASACDTPVVALFCATVPEFGFGPWGVPFQVVEVNGLSCRPCGRHGGDTCPTGTHACQLNIEPLAVLTAIRRLLAIGKVRVGKVKVGEVLH